MKVSIRPAPHSKGCAFAGMSSCGKFQNKSERCENECPAGYCCEMKHCWEVGEMLRDILIARGHKVKMADKKYRKGWPESKAGENTRKAIEELMQWNPDVHVAIHTNASSNSAAFGVRIGYPGSTCNQGENKRIARSKKLAELVVEENRKIYYKPSYVNITNGYNFYELNKPTCPAIYIEGCYANSNIKDAQWWHENKYEIALSYANALEAWWASEGNSLPNGTTPEPEEKPIAAISTAIINTKYESGLSLWDSYKKGVSLIKVKKDEVVNVLSLTSDHGFYYCEYKGVKGYADGKYLLFENKETSIVDAVINTKYDSGLSLWDSYKKGNALIKVPKGEVVKVKSINDDHGFYLCEYKGVEGYADVQYLLFE